MKMPAHFSGQISSMSALLTVCSMAVWEERRMILDSARTYSNKTRMFGMVSALNSGYRSVLRLPGSSLMASFRAKSRSSRIVSSTWVLDDIGPGASVHKLIT